MDWEKAKRNAVREIVDQLDTDDMVRLYNEMAEKNGYTPVMENTDANLDELFSSPSDALCEASGSDYRYTDDYLHYDVFLRSFNYWTDAGSPIDAGEITDFLVREGSGFGVIADDDSDLIEALCEWAGEPIDGEFADWLVGEDLMYADWDSLYNSWKEREEEGWSESDLEDAEEWFSASDFDTMERISGMKRDDYSDEDGYQDFVDAVEEWWDGLDDAKKVEIYYQTS